MIEVPETSGVLTQDDWFHSLFTPFLRVQAAATLLGFSAKHVIRLAHAGTLRGFNLALRIEPVTDEVAARDPRSMLRIQRRSVEILRCPELFRRVNVATLDLVDDLPHRRDTFTNREVMRTFDCEDDHVRRLIAEGLVAYRLVSTTNNTRHMQRASLLSFLRSRELTAP